MIKMTHHQDRHTGFTLVEMLVAVALCLLLMGGIFQSVHLILMSETASREEVLHSQILLALHLKIKRDIQSCVVPYTVRNNYREQAVDETGVPETTLELSAGPEIRERILLQQNLPQLQPPAFIGTPHLIALALKLDETQKTMAEDSSPRLSQILWCCPGQRTIDLPGNRTNGILRWNSVSGTRFPSGLLRLQTPFQSLSLTKWKTENPAVELAVQEIQGVQFRYFDGTHWRNNWDSIVSDSYPQAVEVRLKFLFEDASSTEMLNAKEHRFLVRLR